MALKVDDINDIRTCLNCTRAKCRGYCNIVNNGGNEANHKPREKNKLNYYQRHTEEHRARVAKWKQEHPEKVKEYNRRYREKQKAAKERKKANEC